MKKLIVMVGLPCSGKSSWIHKNYPDAVVISNDLVIEEYADEHDLTYDQVWGTLSFKVIREKCQTKFDEAVKNGAEVIVIDNTNTTIKARNSYKVPAGYERIAVVVTANDKDIKERNAQRSKEGKTIPDEVFTRMSKQFVFPTKEEGFSKVITWKNTNRLI